MQARIIVSCKENKIKCEADAMHVGQYNLIWRAHLDLIGVE